MLVAEAGEKRNVKPGDPVRPFPGVPAAFGPAQEGMPRLFEGVTSASPQRNTG
jgi:hypothetical protein